MFCNKKCNNKIDQSHKRAVGAVYNRTELSLEELLSIGGSVNAHTRNLRSLMTEVYKSLNYLNPVFIWDLFRVKKTPYNLRRGNKLIVPPTLKVNYNLNAFIFRSSILWSHLPHCIKSSESFPV